MSQSKQIEVIRQIHTIEHVVGQCSKWYSEKMQNCIIQHSKSTIDGVEKALADPHSAAICSPPAAKRHESRLNVLASEIQNPNNATLFFVIHKKYQEHKNDSKNSTLFAYPLRDQYKSKVDVIKIAMETLTFITTEWALKFHNGDKWNIVEIEGHPDDLGVKEFIGKVVEILPGARMIGVRGKSINDILEAASEFDSY